MRLTRTPRKPRPDRRPTTPRPSHRPRTRHTTAARRDRLARSRTSRPTDEQVVTPAIPREPGSDRRRLRRRLAVVTELAVLALVLSTSTAHAETTQVLALAGSIDEVLTNTRNYVMGILAGLATLFLSIGGVRYVMGGGDPGEIEKAKVCFKAAGIGYVLAALAPLVVTVLKGIVGA
jgi:hypothetical protein